MKIAGMVVWVLTAGIGVYLLAAGIAAQRQAAAGAAVSDAAVSDAAVSGGAPAAEATVSSGTPRAEATVSSGTPRADATASGGTPAVEGSPLLEFTHPLLALLGLTFWIFFVMTDDRLFAWIAFGVVVATVLAGLSWVITARPAARRRDRERAAGDGAGTIGRGAGTAGRGAGTAGHGFPAHLVMIHGLAAACTFALVVISAVTAAHG